MFSGKQEIGTKIAEFCAHALLALEVLLHPRALSVDDFSTMKSKSDEVHDEIAENIYTDSIRYRVPFLSGTQGMKHYVTDSEIMFSVTVGWKMEKK